MLAPKQLLLTLILCRALAWNCPGALLLSDRWEDGDRTDTNLPEESAWFANSVADTPTLSAAVGSLTGHVRMFDTNTSSRLWITYFTPPGTPVELATGDTLEVKLAFTANEVTTSPATTRGLRIGLFDFSDPGAARVSADAFSTGSGGGAPGANVTGYLLNMNFAQTFTIQNPLQIMKRTDTPNINLMGASGVYASLGSGGGSADVPAFRNAVPYILEFRVRRLQGSAEITTTFSDNDGWSVSFTATDPASPNVRFDAFAIRPNSVADSAETFTFTEFKVETIPFSPRLISVQPDLLRFGMTLSWQTLPGRSYDVQFRRGLLDTDTWEKLDTVTADADTASFTDLEGFFEAQRFYRIVQLP